MSRFDDVVVTDVDFFRLSPFGLSVRDIYLLVTAFICSSLQRFSYLMSQDKQAV